MTLIETQTKAANASVGIEEYRGRIRLRLPRQVCEGKQKWISTGLLVSPENWEKAQMKIWEIEEDIAAGDFECHSC